MKRSLFILSFCLLSLCASASDGFRWIGNRWWGISVSYTQKWYSYSAGGSRHWTDYFGEGGNMQGVRFGVPVQPVLWRGLGVSSGIFCEIYSCKNNAETARIEDVALYFPFHAMWTFTLNSRVSLSVETGPGLGVGLVQRMIDPTDSDAHQYNLPFDEGTPRRVNAYWDAGIGATVGVFRFSVVYSAGLTPSHRFFSANGLMTQFYDVTPTRLTFTAGLVF